MHIDNPSIHIESTQEINGFRLLFLENMLSPLAHDFFPSTGAALPRPAKPAHSYPRKQHLPELCTQVRSVCLDNPFWNDFRLLNYFSKQHISLSLESLHDLKETAGVASKEDVCQLLIKQYSRSKSSLNDQQLRFIERLNPLFLDRNIRAAKPGMVVAYEYFCLRGIDGMLYIHLFIDMFNGYAFGEVSHNPSLQASTALLQNKIIPFYEKKGHGISTILCLCKDEGDVTDIRALKRLTKEAESGIKWKKTTEPTGIIQTFRKTLLNDFLDGLNQYKPPLSMLNSVFARWLQSYSQEHPFEERRNLFAEMNI